MTREDAIKIMDDLGNSPNMKKHGLAAGYVMSALFDYLQKKGKKPELSNEIWGIAGLLHDADYEKTNKSEELHTEETTKMLHHIGAEKEIIDAVRGHADKELRRTLMSKSIYACDELTGLIVAAALVQPDKKLKSLSTESVMRKFKDKSFAAGANRDQIKTCESELKIPLEEFISISLQAMQLYSNELGL
ncbi:HDIG domain-containing protein [Candidatus Curtissbacteria bacterium]|nr:HDIG domain-containing protein [Candidatus Curtissbacteria bacterium]